MHRTSTNSFWASAINPDLDKHICYSYRYRYDQVNRPLPNCKTIKPVSTNSCTKRRLPSYLPTRQARSRAGATTHSFPSTHLIQHPNQPHCAAVTESLLLPHRYARPKPLHRHTQTQKITQKTRDKSGQLKAVRKRSSERPLMESARRGVGWLQIQRGGRRPCTDNSARPLQLARRSCGTRFHFRSLPPRPYHRPARTSPCTACPRARCASSTAYACARSAAPRFGGTRASSRAARPTPLRPRPPPSASTPASPAPPSSAPPTLPRTPPPPRG
jgi:hypothetical protein